MGNREPSVTSFHDASVQVVRFGNPPSGLISIKGAAMLAGAIETALANPAVRGVVLTGAQPGIFIRHADVGQIAAVGDAMAKGLVGPPSLADNPFWRLIRLLDTAPKPVIAAINGVCMGGGLEIALGCTMRLAAPGAGPVGLPEIRIDLFPGAGGYHRLARIMGPHRARIFVLSGSTVSAEQAQAMGIVDEIAENPVERAIELLHGFARRSPMAIAAILRMMRNSAEDGRIDEDMAAFGALVASSNDIRARLRAFSANGEQFDDLD